MRVFINLLFLTFVLYSTHSVAAPEVSNTMTPAVLDATPITGPVFHQDQSPYNFALYAGYAGGTTEDLNKPLSTSILGFRLSLDTDSDYSLDYNAEVNLSDKLIGLYFGRRNFIFTTAEFMPYYKLAAGTHIKATDGLANIVGIKRWQARASIGAANLFDLNNHLYAECGLGLAVVGYEYFLSLGANFNF